MTEILRARERLSPRVKRVTPLPDYKLHLEFTNGEQRRFDAAPLLAYPAFQPLRDEAFFHLVHVEYGTICWPGDIDYCPDTLYSQSEKIESP